MFRTFFLFLFSLSTLADVNALRLVPGGKIKNSFEIIIITLENTARGVDYIINAENEKLLRTEVDE